MLSWFNPLRWWRRFQNKRRWQVVHRRFSGLFQQGNFAGAEQAGEELVALAQKSGDRRLLNDSYYGLMLCLRETGQWAGAIEYGERVLAGQKALSTGVDDPLVAMRLGDLAELMERGGRSDEAVNLYGQALAIRKRLDSGRGSEVAIGLLERLAAV